jgi:hypothetical protein
MDFEELQKVWMADSQETVYVINEKALHDLVTAKKNTALRIANISELLFIVGNFCAGVFVAGVSYWNKISNIFVYFMAVWMFITAGVVLVNRIRRLNRQPRFDRSLQEELQHALATATYQVRLSHLMRLNLFPTGALSVLGVWNGDKTIWFAAGIVLFFCIVYYLSGWEHKIYKRKKRELEVLQNKLKND